MRNLLLAGSLTTTTPVGFVSAAAIDVDEDATFFASEETSPEGSLKIEVLRYKSTWDGSSDNQPPESCAHFETTATSADKPQVVSVKFLPDSRKLVVITRNGDITTIDGLDDTSPIVDVEGTVEPGITSAAWCPDDSLLVLTTGEDKVILMTSAFDVLSEKSMHPSDFGEDAPINVGWGSKQTQFHGSLGKTAAQAPSNVNIGPSPDDDGLPRISWRGDGAFYVVSALSKSKSSSAQKHRVLRVYDIQGVLQSTSEDVAGLEHVLSWRPSGNLIAGTQRFGFEGGGAGKEGRHDIVFFERNGLRHGEFSLPVSDMGVTKSASGPSKWGYKVKELSWSPDSDVLAVWIQFDEFDIVQLWTIGNYHWYLKHEVSAPISVRRFTSIEWHPVHPLHLILTFAGGVIERRYSWDTVYSRSAPPQDSGSVAVIDGATVLLTPFRSQNVPPPMSSCQLAVKAPSHRIPVHAAFAPDKELLAVLWEDGLVEAWDLKTRLRPGRGNVMNPTRLFAASIPDIEGQSRPGWRQLVFATSGNEKTRIALLGTGSIGDDVVVIAELGENTFSVVARHLLPGANGRLASSEGPVVWQSYAGGIFLVSPEEDSPPNSVTSFPHFCWQSRREPVGDTELYIGLSGSGKLHITKPTSPSSHKTISNNTTSFTVSSGFLVFTTTAHEVTFSRLDELVKLLDEPEESLARAAERWEKRKVERGSRIVVAVPSSMALVLQMPRGNLETINPRPLVMEVVEKDLDNGSYKKAFFACRKHRIDLNVLVDHDRPKFFREIPSFIDQVDDVDDINLFLTNVGRGTASSESIAEVCDSVRLALESKSLVKYVNSILTAYVVKTPPDHEAGLSLLLRLRDDHPDIVEDAVKYIIFLVDANSLYNTALGMYDFSLVLMIAQHSQKDPREYLPFLRELRALSKYRQRFKIDDLLKRYESALRNLSLAGEEYFEEALLYVENHQLYDEALKIWKGTDKYPAVLNSYGDWFFDRREYRQATSVFIEAGSLQKAMACQERSLDWQDLFTLAQNTSLPVDEVQEMAYRVSDDLVGKKRYAEAGRVLLDYASDPRAAIGLLIQGNLFSEARRVISFHSLPDLVEEFFYPGLIDGQAQILDDIGEMEDQLRKQVNRVRELRVRKVEEPDAFYGVEDTALHNVDVMTDVSMPLTAFTRYTAAPTLTSTKSKMSSKTKRKMERKVGSGRKGTVDEEEYLLKSITKLVSRAQTVQADARRIMPHLIQATSEHRDLARDLQEHLQKFETELKTAIEEVWKPSLDDPVPVDSWAKRMEEAEKRKNPLDTVPKPSLAGDEWHVTFLRVEMA